MTDLFEHIANQYEQHLGDGTVSIAGNVRPLAFVHGEPGVRDMVAFARAYIKMNRVASVGYTAGPISVTLADGQCLPITDETAVTPGQTGGAVSISRTAGYLDPPDPGVVAITRGK